MKPKLFFSLLLLLGVWGCKPSTHSYPQKEYVVQAFDSIAKYSLHQNTFPFDSLEKEIISQISDSTPQSEIHRKLEYALSVIDQHSYIIRKEQWRQMWEGKNPEVLMNPFPFEGKLLNNLYAYISLDGFSGGDSLAAKHYTDSLQQLILDLYAQQPAGWIIDLRYNSGGWSPSMIAGLGPLLGFGVKAYSISPDRPPIEHYYAKDATDYIRLSDSAWILQKQLPTAVLIGKNTGSAGELLTLALRGNPKTLLIGQH